MNISNNLFFGIRTLQIIKQRSLIGGSMKRNVSAVALAIMIALLLSGSAQAIEIFVWQHDNGLRVQDPVFRQSFTATDAIKATLDDLDLSYTSDQALPDNLCDYDLVMTALSFYCPG